MKFLESAPAFLSALGVGIFVFGLGLTSPIWFLVAGEGPLQAMHSGTPIVVATIVGLIITTIIGGAAYQMRKPLAVPPSPAAPVEDHPWKHVVVHILVVLMFVIPFITIILGLALKQMLDTDAG